MRGRHSKKTPSSAEEKNIIRQQIASFPSVESHYCSKDSQSMSLGASIELVKNVPPLPRQRKKVGAESVYFTSYCEIFRTEFDVGFHDPSIDNCDFCVHFENMTDAEKVEQQEQYDGHHRNKIKVK